MSEQTLQQKLDSVGNVVDFLRNQQTGPNVYPGVPAEYTNWREEQRGWA
jgi:syringate O-demethylase